MAEKIDRRGIGDAQVLSQSPDGEQKVQTEEFQEQKTDSYLLNIETSYRYELFQKIRANFSHRFKPQNVLPIIHKYDYRVLVERDMDEIQCVIEQKGNIKGAESLLNHLFLYKGWLPCLLKVLRDPMVSSGHVADEIEQAVEVLLEERKKQASVVQERADGTYMTDKKTEGAENIHLHEKTSIFGAGESTRGHKMRVTRTVSESVLGQSHKQPLLHRISIEETTIMDPSFYTNETMRRPRSSPLLALTEDTLRKLGTPATETSTDTKTKIKKRSEEPVSDHIPSTSRETQEETTAPEYTDDISSANGYAVGKAMLRQRSTTENKRQMDILLVGKTGNGKSSVGNSILFKEAFESNDSTTSCTKGTQFDYSEFDDISFKVVDGPGLGDTDLDEKDAFDLVLNAMSEAIAMNVEGYHAILIVVPYARKFTKEDVTAVKTMKDIFGEGFIKDHAILVMTHGDNFYKRAKKSKETFKQWCDKQGGEFEKLLSEVENRIVLFDNMADDNHTRYVQVQNLVKIIDGLSSKGKRYNNEMFAKAKESRDWAVGVFNQPILHDSILREAAIISKRFYEINPFDVEEAYECLQSLLERAQKLEQRIKEQDRSTGVPHESITFAGDLKRYIEEEIETIRNILDNRQEKDELTEDIESQGGLNKQIKRHGKVFEEQKQALISESEDQEYERADAGRKVNPKKGKTKGWKELYKRPEKHKGVESVEQMGQPEVIKLTRMLQGDHIKRAELLEEGYRSIKGETTSVLSRMRESVRRLFYSTLQWLQDNFNRPKGNSKEYMLV